jgi:MFS family permease
MKYTAAVTGLLLFPFSVLSALTGKFLMPVLFGRFNVKQTALLGMAFMFMGGLLLSIGTALNYSLALVLLSVACVTGLGIAISFTSLMIMSVQSIPSEQHGVTTGLVSTAYFLGGGLGLSLLSAFMSSADNGVNQLPLLILTMYAVVGILLLAGVIKVYVKAHSAIDVVHN